MTMTMGHYVVAWLIILVIAFVIGYLLGRIR